MWYCIKSVNKLVSATFVQNFVIESWSVHFMLTIKYVFSVNNYLWSASCCEKIKLSSQIITKYNAGLCHCKHSCLFPRKHWRYVIGPICHTLSFWQRCSVHSCIYCCQTCISLMMHVYQRFNNCLFTDDNFWLFFLKVLWQWLCGQFTVILVCTFCMVVSLSQFRHCILSDSDKLLDNSQQNWYLTLLNIGSMQRLNDLLLAGNLQKSNIFQSFPFPYRFTRFL